jgi:hypothetical protein
VEIVQFCSGVGIVCYNLPEKAWTLWFVFGISGQQGFGIVVGPKAFSLEEAPIYGWGSSLTSEFLFG